MPQFKFFKTQTAPPWPTGDLAVPDTDYTPPGSAVRYVSPSGTNSGTAATVGTPWLTITYALANATAGDTIVVRGGTYRQGQIGTGLNFILQAYPHEQVWLDGADIVTGWISDSGRWRKDSWTALFMDGANPVGQTGDPNAINPSFPMAGWPDMVWIDGVYLTQVATLAECGAGEFFVDYATSKLYIGSDPTGKTVEATTRQYALNLEGGSAIQIIRGIGFTRFATSYVHPNNGAIRANKPNVTIEGCAFIRNAGNGVVYYGANGVCRGSKFMYNGKNGLGGYAPTNLIVENNRFSYNNQEGFEQWWDAGGIKIAFQDGGIYRDNLFEDNNCSGLWLDITCTDYIIVRNEFRRNAAFALGVELSARGIVASNWIEGTVPGGEFGGGVGIDIFESNDLYFWNNTLINNIINLQVREGNRTATGADLAAGATWHVTDMSINNNVYIGLNNGTAALVEFTDFDGGTVASTYIDFFDYDTFLLPASPSAIRIKFQTTTAAGGTTNYATLAAFVAAQIYQDNGVEATAAGNPLVQGVSPLQNGNPLPANVAAAINSGLGTPIVTASAPIGRGVVRPPY